MTNAKRSKQLSLKIKWSRPQLPLGVVFWLIGFLSLVFAAGSYLLIKWHRIRFADEYGIRLQWASSNGEAFGFWMGDPISARFCPRTSQHTLAECVDFLLRFDSLKKLEIQDNLDDYSFLDCFSKLSQLTVENVRDLKEVLDHCEQLESLVIIRGRVDVGSLERMAGLRKLTLALVEIQNAKHFDRLHSISTVKFADVANQLDFPLPSNVLELEVSFCTVDFDCFEARNCRKCIFVGCDFRNQVCPNWVSNVDYLCVSQCDGVSLAFLNSLDVKSSLGFAPLFGQSIQKFSPPCLAQIRNLDLRGNISLREIGKCHQLETLVLSDNCTDESFGELLNLLPSLRELTLNRVVMCGDFLGHLRPGISVEVDGKLVTPVQ